MMHFQFQASFPVFELLPFDDDSSFCVRLAFSSFLLLSASFSFFPFCWYCPVESSWISPTLGLDFPSLVSGNNVKALKKTLKLLFHIHLRTFLKCRQILSPQTIDQDSGLPFTSSLSRCLCQTNRLLKLYCFKVLNLCL